MADRITTEQRSAIMSRIRATNTRPEVLVRRVAHAAGYRFRLHRRDLPGTPDLVFPSRQSVVFVHGCFWHRHSDPACRRAAVPKSRPDYWLPKLARNKERDAENATALETAGWRVMIIWECQTQDTEALEKRLQDFLGPPGSATS